MKHKISIILLLISIHSWGCINEYRTLLSGKVILTDPTSGKVWSRSINKDELIIKANELLFLYKQTDSLEYFSDYSASLIYLGEYEKAKQNYFEIEKKSPNLYTTASNLGTIYELIGKPDSALIWIKKSIAINPKSHDGSEWIHIKILEFKLKENENFNESILGLNFGEKLLPENPNKYNLNQLQQNILYQLQERSNFVKPRDKIVGNIYFDYGNVLAQITNLEAALESYEAAKEYGFESELMNNRIEEFQSLTRKARFKKVVMIFIKENFKILFLSGLILIFLMTGLVIYVLYKRKVKFERKQ